MARHAPPTIRNGVRWHNGTGSPAANLGLEGDYYLNGANGAVWEKAGGIWSDTGAVMKGADGADGVDGTNGTNGTDGTNGLDGADGASPHIDTLLSSASAVLTAGYTATPHDLGTITTGTVKPDPANGNFQKMVANGAYTLAAPDAAGSYAITVLVTNGASAGATTESGFTKSSGDDFTTVNGDDFLLYITKVDGFTSILKEALQ